MIHSGIASHFRGRTKYPFPRENWTHTAASTPRTTVCDASSTGYGSRPDCHSSIGGSQPERYNAMMQDIIQALLITPPLDVRGKKDGFNVIYNMNELKMAFIYSSLHTNSKTLKERPALVQRSVAAMADAIHFVEKNPEKAKASVAKILKLNDPEALQSAYNAYAKSLVNRRITVPANAVAEAVEIAREAGTNVKRRPADLFDNTFAENLGKSGFLKEIWGGDVPEK